MELDVNDGVLSLVPRSSSESACNIGEPSHGVVGCTGEIPSSREDVIDGDESFGRPCKI